MSHQRGKGAAFLSHCARRRYSLGSCFGLASPGFPTGTGGLKAMEAAGESEIRKFWTAPVTES